MDTFFKSTEIFSTEYVEIDVKKGKRRLAPFVRPNEESKLIERIGYKTRTYKPPYLKPKMITTAADILKRPEGQNPYQKSEAKLQRAAKQLGKDILTMWESIQRSIEKMAAEAVMDGLVNIIGDGIDEKMDFLRNPNHTISLAGADLWTDPASDPLNDIRTWKRMILQATGYRANVAILGTDVYKAFERHEGVRKILDNRRINNVVEVDRKNEGLPDGVEWVGRAEGVDFYTYDEWYIDNTTGTEELLIPANKLVLGATKEEVSTRFFGAIQDDEALVPVAYFPTSWKEKDPPRRFVMLQSAPLPALHEPDAFIAVEAV